MYVLSSFGWVLFVESTGLIDRSNGVALMILVLEEGENSVGRGGSNRGKGFRMKTRRFSVHRIRVRFMYLIKLLGRWSWKSSFGSLKKGRSCMRRRGKKKETQTRSVGCKDSRMRSFGRSNSFYTEAIADCLDFIKRSGFSMDESSFNQQLDHVAVIQES